MAVTVDVYTESLRTGTGSPHTFSHTGGASPEGVLVGAIHGTSSTDHISAVSYGSLSLERKQRNTDTATEPGAAEWWAAPDGATIPTGTQTVSITCGATTDDILFCCVTLNATRAMKTVDVDGINDNTANPSVTLQYAGLECMSFAALYSGLTSHGAGVIAGGTGVTKLTPDATELAGNFTGCFLRQTTGGTANFAMATTSAADDVAYAAIAYGEVALYTITADSGSYALTGTAATLSYSQPRTLGKTTQPRAGRRLTGRRYSNMERTSARIIIADAGSYAVSGSTVGLKFNRLIGAGAVSYSVSGSAVTLKATFKTVPDSGTYALSGSSVALKFNRLVSVAPGSYALSGTNAALSYGYTVAASSGSYAVSGSTVGLTFNRIIAANAGSYALTGSSATLTYTFGDRSTVGKITQPRAGRRLTGRRYSSFSRSGGYVLVADPGSYALAGSDVILSQTADRTLGKTTQPLGSDLGVGRRYTTFARAQNFVLPADAGTYTVTGSSVSLKFGRSLSAESATYNVTGSSVALTFNRLIAASAGSYGLTGSTVDLAYALRITAASGSYAITGTSVALQYGTDKTIVAEAGSYVVIGTATGLRFASLLPAGSGSYALTGSNLNLISARRLAAASESYSLTGSSTGTFFNRRLSVQSGAYSLTGTAVTFRRGYAISAQGGTYALTGSSVAMQYGSNRQMVAESGAYTVSGSVAALKYSRIMPADSGGYALTGSPVLAALNRRIASGSGSYSLTGSQAGLYRGRGISADPGSYALDGTSLGFLVSRAIAIESGAYSVSMSSIQQIRRMVLTDIRMDWPSVSEESHRWGGVDAEVLV